MNPRIGISPTVICTLVFLFSGDGLSAETESGAASADSNPFSAFFGEWTLKDDKWQHVFDGSTLQTLNIPNHYTRCDRINTERSVLCVVNAGELKGHIMWSYDSDKERVHHLSHFGTARNGVGVGSLDAQANLRLNVTFQDEPGTYRIYRYTWVSKNEYTMMSRQFASDGTPTGNWYGGTFVRIGER